MSNIINIKINYGDEDILDVQLLIDEPVININDNFLLNIIKPLNISRDLIKSCRFRLGLVNAFVNIIDYTLTDIIYIDAFFNQSSSIAVLKCINTNLHIINQHIKKLQVCNDSIVIDDCNISEIDICIKQMDNRISNIKNINIRNSVIHEMSIFASCDYINIQESELKIIRFAHRFEATKNRPTDKVNIWRNCTINVLDVSCMINELNISESTVYSFMAKSKCKIDTLKIEQSIINATYNFDLNSFGNLNIHSWLIISKSASSSRNIELRADANYNIANLYMKQETYFHIPLIFFKITTGYGYKPFRTIWFSLANIIIFGCIFSFLDNLTYIQSSSDIVITADIIMKIVDSLKKNILYSFGNYIGLNGNCSFTARHMLSSLESLMGIVTVAMFVNALYVKYKD